ncbi:MAG: glycosyltransferase [Candidatus Omnitrophota bacterium]
MDKQKVSVIIPTYNSGRYIEEAVASVLNQTYTNYELLIVDDGSTDNTVELLKKYKGRFRYYYQRNQGIVAARNLALENSTGEFVAFLDADDLWLPEKLGVQMRVMREQPNLAFVYSCVYTIDESGKTIRYWDNKDEKIMDFNRLYDKNFICCSSVLLRRSCLERSGRFDPRVKMSQDWDLWLRLAKNFNFKFINQFLAKYRIHPSNISTRYEDRIRAIFFILSKPEISGDFSWLKRTIRRAIVYCRWGDYLYRQEDKRKAGFIYLRAALTFPFVGAYHFGPQSKKVSLATLYKTLKLYFKIFSCFTFTRILTKPLIYFHRFLKNLFGRN